MKDEVESEASEGQRRVLHIVTLTANLLMIHAFAQHILQTQCVSGTGCGPPGTMSVRRPLPGHILVKRDAVDSFLSVKSKRGLKLLN